MKRLILSLVLLFSLAFSASAFAGVVVKYAEWDKFLGQKRIAVEFSTDSLKYKRDHPLAEFLYKAKRADDWKAQSLQHFLNNFNMRLAVWGVEAYSAESGEKSAYVLRLMPHNVSSGGKLEGEGMVVDVATNDVIISFSFASSDGDDDDEITFRDPMRELGDTVGKTFSNKIKSHSKRNKRQ